MSPLIESHTVCIVRVADSALIPWRNGGGHTRELLCWPTASAWDLRLSVADIVESGAFSVFPGVDRWIAVLSGDGIELQTSGHPPRQLTASLTALHPFPGDVSSHCITLGVASQDFNVMWRRTRGRLQTRPLQPNDSSYSTAPVAALFIAGAATLEVEPGGTWCLPAMSLAWWSNPNRERRKLTAWTEGSTQEKSATRGWWLEAEF